MNLSEINIGETCTITKLNIQSDLKRRLLDLGMIEGTKVQCVLESPLGDPVAYKIRGALIALRKYDTNMIEIVI